MTRRASREKRGHPAAGRGFRGKPRKNKRQVGPSRLSPRTKRVLIWGSVGAFGTVVLCLLTVLLLFLYYSYGTNLPDVETLKRYKPVQAVRILDSRGRLLGYMGRKRRTMVPVQRIPKSLINAVVSAEDSRFFQHEGLNYFGMLRAFWVNLWAGRYKQGGSTITQQVVKTLLLSPERTIRRKFQEVILARRLEQTLSKQEILNIYLNEIYLGHGRYGVEEASLFYFGKHVWKISLGEAAVLASLPQGPELLSPIRHPERCKRRQIYVLEQMEKNGFITHEEAQKVILAPLPRRVNSLLTSSTAAEVVDLVKQRFRKSARTLEGKSVVTTVDLDLQRAVRRALQEGLRAYDQRQRVTHLTSLTTKRRAAYLAKLTKRGAVRLGPVYEGIVTGRHEGQLIVTLGREKGVVVKGMERYYPKGYRFNPPPEPRRVKKRRRRRRQRSEKPAVRVGDLFRVMVIAGKSGVPGAPLRLQAELGPQGAVVVMDVKSKAILAMVGGYTMKPGDFNRATRAKRQPGSSFKPFVYASALASKKYTTASLLNDGPEVHAKWVPRNHGRYFGAVTLRKALANSINSIAVHLLKSVGVSRVVSLVESAGITTPMKRDLSIALGTSEVSLLELVTAYGIFPSLGVARPSRFLEKVGPDLVPVGAAKRVLSPAVAWLTVSLMRSVVREGTGRRARKLRFPVAGKTGTTNRSRDAWFIGFTSSTLCGVWIGFDDHKPLGRLEEGGRTALPVFVKVMAQVQKKRPSRGFSIPSGIVSKLVDKKRGTPVFPGTKGAVKEFFLGGTEPPDPVAPPVVLPGQETGGEDPGDPDELLTE